MNFAPFRDWFFDRMIWPLISGEWTIEIKDFKSSKNKRERNILGLTEPYSDEEGGVIYLNKDRGTPKILLHELGHVFFWDLLDAEARDKNRTKKEIEKWIENQILIFERIFFICLSIKQKKILKTFIDRAKIDFKHNFR